MVTEGEYSIVEQNLRATMPFFGQASGAGDVTEKDGMLLVDSGVNYSVFNIAMLTSGVENADTLAFRLLVAARYFEQRKTRWSLWLCDDLLAAPVRQVAPTLFAAQHLRRLTEAPGMIANRLRTPERPLPAIEVHAVCDSTTREDFGHITSMNFDIPFATCRSVYGNEQAWTHAYHGFVGYWHGMAVTTTAVVMAADSIGIYSVGTLPQYRRKGFAEAMMRRVIADHTRQTGIERTVLQSTRAGLEMYRRMGYRPVGHFTVYMT